MSFYQNSLIFLMNLKIQAPTKSLACKDFIGAWISRNKLVLANNANANAQGLRWSQIDFSIGLSVCLSLSLFADTW